MTVNHQQFEKEISELAGKGFSPDSVNALNALEAACQILDHQFGKDFHKKNPKLAVRFADTIMKSTRMKELKEIIQNDISQHLEALRVAIEDKELKNQKNLIDNFADSFRF